MAANGISTLATKQERQVAKLEYAQAKRKGRVITDDPGGVVGVYGTWSDDGTDNDTVNYYRSNNTYDISSLPDIYNGNVPGADDNPNPDGLLQKRPWIAVSAIAAPVSIEESVDGGSIADLQIWYDGADLTTYIPSASDEGQITQWTDKSSFAHNANPNGGSAKPTYENTTLQNGYGYIEFDGNDNLNVNPFTQLNGATGFTIFVVSNVLTATGTEYMTDTDTADFGMFSDGGTMKLTMSGGYTRTTDATVSADTWHQHTLIYDGGSTSLTYRLDKTTAGTAASSGSVPATTGAAGTFYIGDNDAQTGGLSGYVAEVIIFNRVLTSTEYSNVENYLSNKWGL